MATLALTLASSSVLKRGASPLVIGAGSQLRGGLLGLELHPADFDQPRHVLALERALTRARPRRAITYDDLCSND